MRDCIVSGVQGDGIELLASSHNRIERCTISGVGGHGIQITKSSTVCAMTETYQDKLDNFCRGRSFLKLRGGVRNSTGELCEACGSGQPGTLFGIRELVTGLDHFVGCPKAWEEAKSVIRERMRLRVPQTGRAWTREELYDRWEQHHPD